MSFLQGPEIPVRFGFNLWRVRNEIESHYASELTGIRVLVEVWSSHAVTADVHENVVIRTDRILPTDGHTSKEAMTFFRADTVRYERTLYHDG